MMNHSERKQAMNANAASLYGKTLCEKMVEALCRCLALLMVLMLQLMVSYPASADNIYLGNNGHQDANASTPLYQTNDSIYASDFSIASPLNITFKAGNEIVLSPPFAAAPGSTFTASIITYSVNGAATYNGSPFAGKQIYISGTTRSGVSYSAVATTDANGNYTFNAPMGTYTISELEDGYALQDGDIEVKVDSQNVSVSVNLTIVEVNLNLAYYYQDLLGNTMVQTDDKGTILLSATYQPYGDTFNLFTEGAYKETHLYSGKEFDKAGLYNFGARYYDPSIGRFLSIDPAGGKAENPQSWNRYAYCYNNPYRFVDRNGEWAKDVHYEKTLTWARSAGFNSSQSKAIALACNDVDSPSSGISFLPGKFGDQSYHFNTNGDNVYGTIMDSRWIHAQAHLKNAIEWQTYANAALKVGMDASVFEERALKELGTGLHALQDISGHPKELQWYVNQINMYGHDQWIFLSENISDRFIPTEKRSLDAGDATMKYFQGFIKGTEK